MVVQIEYACLGEAYLYGDIQTRPLVCRADSAPHDSARFLGRHQFALYRACGRACISRRVLASTGRFLFPAQLDRRAYRL
jgi:hypothetical protein